jgi:lysozyme
VSHVEQRLREIADELYLLADDLPEVPVLLERTPLEQAATQQLRRDEGEVLHAYQDSLGYWTIGIGVLIDKKKGGGITPAESEMLFVNRLRQKIGELDQRIPWWRNLNEARQGVLLNMAYQMGVGELGKSGLLGFVNTLKMVQQGAYEDAADTMLKSKWASQTPQRAQRLSEQMRSGSWM